MPSQLPRRSHPPDCCKAGSIPRCIWPNVIDVSHVSTLARGSGGLEPVQLPSPRFKQRSAESALDADSLCPPRAGRKKAKRVLHWSRTGDAAGTTVLPKCDYPAAKCPISPRHGRGCFLTLGAVCVQGARVLRGSNPVCGWRLHSSMLYGPALSGLSSLHLSCQTGMSDSGRCFANLAYRSKCGKVNVVRRGLSVRAEVKAE